MNVSETACSKLDVIVLPLGIWRKSYSSTLCPKYMHQKRGFFELKMQNFHCPGGPSPVRLLCYLAVLLADYFRRHGNISHFPRRSLANYQLEGSELILLSTRYIRPPICSSMLYSRYSDPKTSVKLHI